MVTLVISKEQLPDLPEGDCCDKGQRNPKALVFSVFPKQPMKRRVKAEAWDAWDSSTHCPALAPTQLAEYKTELSKFFSFVVLGHHVCIALMEKNGRTEKTDKTDPGTTGSLKPYLLPEKCF